MPKYNMSYVVTNPHGMAMKDGGPVTSTDDDGNETTTSPPDLKIGSLCFIAMQAPHESDNQLKIADKKKNFELLMKLTEEDELTLTKEEADAIISRMWLSLHFISAGLGERALKAAEIKDEVKDKVSETQDVAPVE